MQIRTDILPRNGRYEVQLGLDPIGEPLSGKELDAIREFGNFLVNFGGTFTDGPLTFTLPDDERSVPIQLPVKQNFYVSDYEDDTAAAANLYATTIKTRIADGLAALLIKPTGSIGSTVTNL